MCLYPSDKGLKTFNVIEEVSSLTPLHTAFLLFAEFLVLIYCIISYAVTFEIVLLLKTSYSVNTCTNAFSLFQ